MQIRTLKKKEISTGGWGVSVAILGWDYFHPNLPERKLTCSSSTGSLKHVNQPQLRSSRWTAWTTSITLRGVFPDLRWEFPMPRCVWERWGCSWLHWLPAGDGLGSGVWNGAALALLFLTGTQTAFGPHNLETNTHTHTRAVVISQYEAGELVKLLQLRNKALKTHLCWMKRTENQPFLIMSTEQPDNDAEHI